MAFSVVLPSYLRAFADGQQRLELSAQAATLNDALDAVRHRYPGIYDRIVTERGEIRQHVNIFVGDENVRFTGGLATPVSNGNELFIVPAVSGG